MKKIKPIYIVKSICVLVALLIISLCAIFISSPEERKTAKAYGTNYTLFEKIEEKYDETVFDRETMTFVDWDSTEPHYITIPSGATFFFDVAPFE